jgi:hypothetical protein
MVRWPSGEKKPIELRIDPQPSNPPWRFIRECDVGGHDNGTPIKWRERCEPTLTYSLPSGPK